MTSYHSRAVGCELCGQLFFPSSLPFHMKQCVIKQDNIEVPCPHCDKGVRKRDLNTHIDRECRKARSSAKVPSASCCAVCGRRFAGDRLLKHQVICRRNSSSTHIPRHVSPSIEVPPSKSIPWREKRDEMKRQMREHMSKGIDGSSLTLSDDSIETPGEPIHQVNQWKIDDSLELHCYDSLDEENIPPSTAWTVEWPGTKALPKKSYLNLISLPPPHSPARY